jgi:hypothetical protein
MLPLADKMLLAVTQATYLAVPSGYIKKHKYLAWLTL